MTFLELCQRVRQESGISGSGPESVLNQKAILEKVVQWVKQADLDVQQAHEDWLFMWRMSSVTLVSGVNEYLPTALSLSGLRTIEEIEINGYPLRHYTWKQFKASRKQLDNGKCEPTAYTVKPDGAILFSPKPDKNYQAIIEYSMKPIAMQNDDDEPIVPEDYHPIILQKALMYYASHEEDNSLYQVAAQRYDEYLSLMAHELLPQLSIGRGF